MATPRGQTALNRSRKKADEGAKPSSTRESRQFSQLSDLHPCSSFTGRLLRQTRRGRRKEREKEREREKTAPGSDGTRSGSSASYAVQCSIFLRAYACTCEISVYKNYPSVE